MSDSPDPASTTAVPELYSRPLMTKGVSNVRSHSMLFRQQHTSATPCSRHYSPALQPRLRAIDGLANLPQHQVHPVFVVLPETETESYTHRVAPILDELVIRRNLTIRHLISLSTLMALSKLLLTNSTLNSSDSNGVWIKPQQFSVLLSAKSRSSAFAVMAYHQK